MYSSFKRLLHLVCAMLILSCLDAQSQSKRPIDSSVYGNWETVESPSITDDGKYITYSICKVRNHVDRVIVTSADLKWKISLPASRDIHFTPDSKALILKDDSDNLAILKLGTSLKEIIPNVISEISVIEGKPSVLAYVQEKSKKVVVVRNLSTGKESRFPGFDNFQFNANRKLLVLQSSSDTNTNIAIVNLANSASKIIYEGFKAENIIIDEQGKQMLFTSFQNGNIIYWYFHIGMKKATVIATNDDVVDRDVQLGNIERFSNDGTRAFISLTEKLGQPIFDPVTLNVWTYTDKVSQVAQLSGNILNGPQAGPQGPIKFSAVLDISSHKIIRLQSSEENVRNNSISIAFSGNDDWGIYEIGYDSPGVMRKTELALVNTKDGSRKDILHSGALSPQGNYLVYFDMDQKKFFSQRIADGTIFEISKNIETEWYNGEPGYGASNYARSIIAGWLQNEKGVFLYDLYDIWQVDLEGRKPPINITNGFGTRNKNILFFMVEDYMHTPFKGDETILLTAFNPKNKDNGFCRITLGQRKNPEKLIMGPYAYSLSRNYYVPNQARFEPIKAKKAEVYIVRRQSEVEAPNFFVTNDFKRFTPITDVQPHKEFNWYTTELHSFTNPDGKNLQGVLYKPEDFDPKKKYPVIFYYYTKLSDNLHIFETPEASDGRLNISWYVSNGYLVFTPDISHPVFGEVFKGALASIVSAAKYIGSLPYVNPKKLGMQGISWGGIQTNYFVTHTDLFASACSASGLSDFVSQYNVLSGSTGASQHVTYETGWQGPGKTLWEMPQWYLDNSPVMSADKVTTPLLMMETTKDGACPFVNAFELYNALRRLGKKVWLLEYTESNHGVWGKEALDFDIRMQQFFNCFLKDAPAPRWMTQGRPARFKNFENRLELDEKFNEDKPK